MKPVPKVQIRPYILDDIGFICHTVALEIPKLPCYKDITVSTDRVGYLLKHNHGNGSNFQAWVLYDEETKQLVGGMAGHCGPGMITWDLVATDIFLFILPGWRSLRHLLMLLVAYKDWAKARGAKLIMATQTSGYKVAAMGEVMRRQGYIETGSQWMLRLDDEYLNRH